MIRINKEGYATAFSIVCLIAIIESAWFLLLYSIIGLGLFAVVTIACGFRKRRLLFIPFWCFLEGFDTLYDYATQKE